MPTSHPRINAYCASHGWLFDDLKRQFAELGAIATDTPLPGSQADAYICIRTGERSLSPKPQQTVVQIHDMRRYRIGAQDAGCLSLVHPAQQNNSTDFPGRIITQPIGSRTIPTGPLPTTPTLGFFCREVRGLKRSKLFGDAVQLARQRGAEFKVLMIGHGLDEISHLGRWERRAAAPLDYQRITALVVCSVSPMIPLSAYEACAAGRRVITTPRQWPSIDNGESVARDNSAWPMVHTVADAIVEAMASAILQTVRHPQQFASQIPFHRDRWIERQIAEARRLCPSLVAHES